MKKEPNNEIASILISEEKQILDLNSKNLFKKIKIDIIYQILNYVDFFTLVDISFTNRHFREMANKKYYKKIQMIITSIKNYKSQIIIQTNEDFRLILKKNSMQIRREIKPLIMNILSDYYHKLPVLKYYLTRMKNRSISLINLKGIEVAKKSVKYLSYYISDNASVEMINLSKNKLTGSVLSPLVEGVRTVRNLKVLKMDNCLMDNSSMTNLNKIISNGTIDSISLKNCNLDDYMISLLTNCTEYTFSLNLYGNNLTSTAVFHICKKFRSLRNLNMGKNNLDFSSTIYLAAFLQANDCRLEILNLEQNYISSFGMNIFLQTAQCGRNQTLKEINFGHNICQNLKELPKNENSSLRTLKLSANKFHYEDYQILFKNFMQNDKTKLQNLDLSENIISEKTLVLILDMILECSITNLSLQNCFLIKSEFLLILHDYFVQSKCPLTHLNLSMNYLGNGNYNSLSEIIKMNKLISLNLSNNDLNLCEETFTNFCQSLKSNSSLQFLDLSNNFLEDKVLTLFDNINPTMKELKLENNNINSYENIYHISQSLSQLEKLSLRNNNIIDTNCIPLVDSCKGLKQLDLRDNKITVLILLKFLEVFKLFDGKLCPLINLKSKTFSDSYKSDKSLLSGNINSASNLLLKFFKF